MKRNNILILLLLLSITSCIPQKKLLYMQDYSSKEGYKNPYTEATSVTEAYKIMPKDYLYIRVLTPKEEIANLYNLGGGAQGNTMNMMQGGSAKFMSYLVNDDGNIDFPYVGEVHVKGLTLSEIKLKLTEILQKHIDTFTLQVQLTQAQFTILGEVRAPGQYGMSKDQLTLYEAFAQAGDMTVYGKRKQVKIIRPTETGTQMIMVDLTDKNIIDSQDYYILPNDLIYVEPMRVKQMGFGETFSLSLVTSLISFYLLIQSLISTQPSK
jgi:polysaccharide biosynthesis/export protein